MSSNIDFNRVEQAYRNIQQQLVANFEKYEDKTFCRDEWQYPTSGGGCAQILEKGSVFERAGVNFSAIAGNKLPNAATIKYPQLENAKFQVVSVSAVAHPINPYIPTSHLNVRFFIAQTETQSVWWFGGGFDLTPYYPEEEDCIYWHKQAKNLCDKYDKTLYPKFKQRCDDYFYLKHREEHRGIGGIFYDDFNELAFEDCFAMSLDVAKTYIQSYLSLVDKYKKKRYNDMERGFQCYRRGRYVEFNLVHDRGTLFGLQSSGRVESILMSMPPVTHWQYNQSFTKGSAEERLTSYFLQPKNWASMD